MKHTLFIRVKDGYEYVSVAGKEVRSTVAPVLKGFRKVLDFDRETGDLLLEAEFQFQDGRIEIEEEPLYLKDILCWAFYDPVEIIGNITEIVLE